MTERYDVLVVGGGPAGIAAAVTAGEAGARVAIVDERPHSGGQFWHRDHGAIPAGARPWLVRLEAANVTTLTSTAILDVRSATVLETTRGVLRANRLVLACGARELFLPFPGWTLPGVTGVGALQSLVHDGLDVGGQRIVLAGSGPLLLQVAASLQRHGGEVVRVAEQASFARLAAFACGLGRARFAQAVALRNTRLRTSTWPVAAQGETHLEAVVLNTPRGEQTIACQRLGVGFSLIANLELARRLGCCVEDNVVVVDDSQATSVENVFAAGEICGIKGAPGALAEGICAGAAAVDLAPPSRARSTRDRERRFAQRLARAFALRPELASLADDKTILCRCEDVLATEVADSPDWTSAKLQTRCGMGLCQGRVCGAAAQHLYGWGPTSTRPPLVPVSIADLTHEWSAT